MKTKKIDVKKLAKVELSELISEYLKSIDIPTEKGTEYGFTEGTLVAPYKGVDIQIKLITPKAGLVHYEKIADEDIDF